MDSIYQAFALLLMVSALIGAVAVRLRQPLLVAYIVVGIMVGPAVFGWAGAHSQIDLLAQIGITVLLFVVGLKLDLRHIRHIGPVALASGLGQLTFTMLFGFLIVQDLAVVIAMMVMSGLGGMGEEGVSGGMLALTLLARLGGAVLLLFIVMRYVLLRIVDTLACSQELLLVSPSPGAPRWRRAANSPSALPRPN